MLMGGIVALVVGFGSSDKLGRRLWPGRDGRHAGRRRAGAGRGDPGVEVEVAGRRRVFGLLAIPTSPSSSPTRSRSRGRLAAAAGGGLVFFTITTWRRGRQLVSADWPMRACRSPSSSSAWSARPTASPAPRSS
jgi:hypothetical protein